MPRQTGNNVLAYYNILCFLNCFYFLLNGVRYDVKVLFLYEKKFITTCLVALSDTIYLRTFAVDFFCSLIFLSFYK